MNKEKVIVTTLDVVKNKKLEKTSISEITKKSKMSPGNIYYYFNSKNDIYNEVAHYALDEIKKELCKLKLTGNKNNDLFSLTKKLITFLEKRDEILFFLVSASGSSYLDKNLDAIKALGVYKQILLNDSNGNKDRKTMLKLRMFMSSLLEILYINVFVEKRNLSKEEIEEVCSFYWHENKNDKRVEII